MAFGITDLYCVAPIVALVIGAFTVLIVDAVSKLRGSFALELTSLSAVAVAAVAILAGWSQAPALAPEAASAIARSIAPSPLGAFAGLVVLGAAGVSVLYSVGYATRLGIGLGEYYGLLLFASAGMLALVVANDLITLFIAFELMSLSVYALAGIWRQAPHGNEGAMKYFVLGSFSSAFLLYGLALLYGATGTVYLDAPAFPSVAAHLGHAEQPNGLVLAAIGLLVVGFGFKVGAVPFHSWIPDAYEGAPASVTGFMATAVKAAAFAAFLKILAATGILFAGDVAGSVLLSLAALTMIVGNVAALLQKSVQRMLAYSGIAHSGYVLVGLTAATRDPAAAAAALFYLASYAAMTIGAFAVLTVVRRDGRGVRDIDELAGLARERPGAALAMTLFMVSLVGVPPTAGFMGKLWLFRGAVDAGFTPLVVLAVVTTAVSIYYYLRVVVVMYMGEAPAAPAVSAAPPAREATFSGSCALALAAAATLLLGIFPSRVLDYATASVAALVGR